MTLLVCVTGAIGFLTSFILLHLSLTTLWLRYLIAMIAAYCAFLFLLWVWAKTREKHLTDRLDLPDFGKVGRGGGSKDCSYEGKGGDFGGGGASSSYHPDAPAVESPSGNIADFVPELELEELAIPIIVLITVVLLVGSAFLVIINAPALFAELILDGILSANLYRRLQGLDQKHWLETAIRKTGLPFATITLLLVAFGWTIQWLDPSANSIGEFLSHRR